MTKRRNNRIANVAQGTSNQRSALEREQKIREVHLLERNSKQ